MSIIEQSYTLRGWEWAAVASVTMVVTDLVRWAGSAIWKRRSR